MFKAKHKFSLFAACLTLLLTMVLGIAGIFSTPSTTTASAATTDITMNIYANKGTTSGSGANSQISWTQDGVTFVNIKSSSSNAIRTSDSDHYRVYAKSIGSITAPGNITQVVITSTGSGYTSGFNTSAGTKTISGSTITVTDINSTTLNYTSTAQWRLKKIVVTYEEAPTCNHVGGDWVYDASKKQHYQTCANCEQEIEDTRELCADYDDFEYGDYTTASGKHTRTLTCNLCGGEQTESGDCEVVASDYVREGNKHYQTGTCQVCGDETTVWEDCTLDYTYASNNDKTHNTTSTCSVCEQSATTENVACSFNEGTLDGTTLTYTCDYCAYSYTEEATVYTVSFVVPNGIEEVEAIAVAENFTAKLPEASTVEGYTFAGWVEATLDEKTEVAPTFYEAGDEYTVTEDITLYALYTYSEGTGAFTKVTDADTLAVGKEIVIVASGSNHALGADKGNNRNAATITKSGDTVTINDEVQIITLEEGTVANTFAFNVGNNSYLYAASSSSNYLKTSTTKNDNASWLITIANGIATIKAQGSYTRNWLRKNSSSALFACYGSGQNDVSIYMKDGATYYVTAFNTCAHENVNEVLEEATCLTSGFRTVTCLDCEAEIVSEILPALGHNFVDDICENCGNADPASIVYNGFYYLSVNGKYAGEKDGNYYKLFDFTPDETINANYVFYFVQNDTTYDMYNLKAGLIAKGVTIATQENYAVHITNNEGKILSHNTSYTTYQRLGFYSNNSYPRDIILTAVELNANIDSASITVGADFTLNYYVTMDEDLAENAKMYITVGENEEEEYTYTVDGDRYKFSLNIPPQCMADLITATLKSNGLVLDTVEYSIKTYAQSKLNESSPLELKQLVSDMLRYGAAAQNYKDYNTGNLATNGVENLVAASDAVAPEVNASPVKNSDPEITSYPAYFKSATVFFNDVNQIFVHINTTENVTLTVNGVEVELTGTTYKTEGILATEFDKEFTFALYHNGVLMQTLTYSVNAYAYRTQINTQADANMKALATALYRYGVSAKDYKDYIASLA